MADGPLTYEDYMKSLNAPKEEKPEYSFLGVKKHMWHSYAFMFFGLAVGVAYEHYYPTSTSFSDKIGNAILWGLLCIVLPAMAAGVKDAFKQIRGGAV